MYRYTSSSYRHFYKGENFCDVLFGFPGQLSPSYIGSTIKGKNLLLREQILSHKSGPLGERETIMKKIDLVRLKVCP